MSAIHLYALSPPWRHQYQRISNNNGYIDYGKGASVAGFANVADARLLKGVTSVRFAPVERPWPEDKGLVRTLRAGT